MCHAVFQTQCATVDSSGDGHHVTGIGQGIESVSEPEPAGTIDGAVFVQELVGILNQGVVIIEFLATLCVVAAAGDLNDAAATKPPRPNRCSL